MLEAEGGGEGTERPEERLRSSGAAPWSSASSLKESDLRMFLMVTPSRVVASGLATVVNGKGGREGVRVRASVVVEGGGGWERARG